MGGTNMLRLILLLLAGILANNRIQAEPLISDDTAGLLEDDELGSMVQVRAMPYHRFIPYIHKYIQSTGDLSAYKRSASTRDFIKKSLKDGRNLRFHQCYFNPISCF